MNHKPRPIPPPGPADAGHPELSVTADVKHGGALHAQAEMSHPRRRSFQPSKWEVSSGLLMLVAWGLVFAVGVIFPSRSYIETLQAAATGNLELSPWQFVGRLLSFLMSYTATNAALLCCLSAWLGELGRRTRIDGQLPYEQVQRGDYIAAIMRGFLAYLAIVSGFIIAGSGVRMLITTDQQEYIRLAAFVSLLGFLTGFSPGLFRGIEERIAGTLWDSKDKRNALHADVEGPATVQIGAGEPTNSKMRSDTASHDAGQHGRQLQRGKNAANSGG
jgi:hypothetical protein